MALRIEFGVRGPVLRFAGDLTIFQVGDYRRQLLEMPSGGQEAVADLSATTDLDGAGLQLLIALQKQLRAAGSELSLQDPAAAVTAALAACNLSDHFRLEQTPEQR